MEQGNTDTVATINCFVSPVDDECHKNIGTAQVVVVLAQLSVCLAQLVMTMPYSVSLKVSLSEIRTSAFCVGIRGALYKCCPAV